MSDIDDMGLEPHGVRDCVVWLVAHAKELDKKLEERDRAQAFRCDAHSLRLGKLEDRATALEHKQIWVAGAFATLVVGFEMTKDSIARRLGIK
jgi:hypothetical protein